MHAACMWRACGVHAVRMHAVGRRTGELGGEEVLRRCAQVELVDVVLREDGPLGATVEPGLAARRLQLLREQVQERRLARAVRPAELFIFFRSTRAAGREAHARCALRPRCALGRGERAC